MSEKWLETLKAGDVVVIDSHRNLSLARVDRMTPTQIIIGSSKFRRSSGRLVTSDRWSSSWLHEATPARRLEIRRASAVRLLLHAQWSEMDDETLFEIEDRVRQFAELKKANG